MHTGSEEQVRPPIRWAGSKRSILHKLARFTPPRISRYVEPFAGSAALFFYLTPQKALLGDINRDLVSFYHVLSLRPRALARVVAGYDQDGEDYYHLRDQTSATLSRTDAAARFFYLNRFCFNGVYRTNRAGEFNVPRGNRTGAMPTGEDLYRAAVVLRRATIQASDFEETLDATRRGDFVYIDPPYFTRKGIKPGEYGYESLEGQNDLARLVASLERLSVRGVKYLLSYSESRSLTRQLDPAWVRLIKVRRHVGGTKTPRRFERELMIANYVPQA